MWHGQGIPIKSVWRRLLPRRGGGGDAAAAYSHPHVQAVNTVPGGVTMFEQREQRLAELREHTRRKELVTCTSGHMPLTAITAETPRSARISGRTTRAQIRN
jgi:hypothetical protein